MRVTESIKEKSKKNWSRSESLVFVLECYHWRIGGTVAMRVRAGVGEKVGLKLIVIFIEIVKLISISGYHV